MNWTEKNALIRFDVRGRTKAFLMNNSCGKQIQVLVKQRKIDLRTIKRRERNKIQQSVREYSIFLTTLSSMSVRNLLIVFESFVRILS